MKNSVCFSGLLVALFLGCVRCDAAGLPPQYTPKPARQPTYFVIKNVNVIQMTSTNRVIEQATVVIENGHIEVIAWDHYEKRSGHRWNGQMVDIRTH
ncbi:hypothetical protein GCM10028816_53220 [Spirosoma lituiforme]